MDSSFPSSQQSARFENRASISERPKLVAFIWNTL